MVELADVVTAAEALLPLGERADGDPAWQLAAAPTSWSAAHTVEHIADALVFYAGQAARRADRRLPVLRDGRSAPPGEQLDKPRSTSPAGTVPTSRCSTSGCPC